MATTVTGQTSLPVQLTSFIGRREQVAQLVELVAAQRLVTICGTGGCGKTRLAIEALSAARDRRPDVVSWVDLAAVVAPAFVPEVVAAAAGVLVGAAADPTVALVGGLGDHQVVLGIDNCEHLLEPCGELIEHILRSCPGVSVLATSREPLGVAGETVWRVPSMDEHDVVALFIERARAARADFLVDGAGEEAVRRVCRRLDGIPLAVELAAAWTRVLTPAQVETALDDRFRLLVGGPRRWMPRHRTLLASVEWSDGLLRDDARLLLRRLAVFPSSFDLATAEAICSDETFGPEAVLPALTQLVDASIVVVGETGGVARYRLPETIREYAMERPVAQGEMAALRDRHLAHFLAIAEEAETELDHGDQDVVLRRLETDHGSLRAALDWGLAAPDPGPGRRLAAAMVRMWFLHGHAREGIDALEQAASLGAADDGLQAEILNGLALLAIPAGRMDLSMDASARAIEAATRSGSDRALARAHVYASYVPFHTDYRRAQELALVAQRLGSAAGDTFAVDFGQLVQAVSLGNEDRFDEVVPIADELFARCEPRHDRFCAAFSRNVLVYASAHTGDVHRAIELGRAAVRIAQPLRDYFTTGTVTSDLAWAHGLAGHLDDAQRLTSGLARSFGSEADADVVGLRVTVARLHLWGGNLEDALVWAELAARFADPGIDNWTAMRALPTLASALRRVGRTDEAAAAAEQGAAMASRLGTPHARAESLDELARLALDADDLGRAEDLYQEALAIRRERRLLTHMADSLDGLARVATAREEHLDAARLLAASDRARAESGYPRPLVDTGAHTELDTALRRAIGDAAHSEARREGGDLRLDDAIAYVTRARGQRGRPSVGWASLTPTELEVVALVAKGLTNPQIAERLFVSRATVKTHLSHVFTKLDVASRAELAALATQRRQLDSRP